MSFGFGFALPAYPLRGGGGNNPFNQSGPTLDLSFAGVVTDNTDPNGYTLTTNFITPQYQVAAQYTIWETGVGLVDKTFSQIITFTRASTGTFTGSNGLIQSAAIDAPRFDYDPVTLAAKGLLIEEQRTNLFVRSEEFDVTANWTPSNLTVTANTDTAPNGTLSADTLTATAANAVIQQAASVTNATVYTYSVWIKRKTGTGAVSLSDLNGNYVPVTVDATWTRCSLTSTAASTTGRGYIRLTTSGDEVYVWGAQLEAGSFATSYIPTVASQVTRSADVASVNTLSPWYNATEGTYAYEYLRSAGTSGSAGRIFASGVGGSNNYGIWVNQATGSQDQLTIRDISGDAVAGVLFGVNTVGINKGSVAYKVNDFAWASNGAAPSTDTTGVVPSQSDQLRLGRAINTDAAYLNGHIRRITYYPRRLSNAELQAITA